MDDIETRYRIQESADWLCSRSYSIVTAQFPDDLLKDAARITTALRNACSAQGHDVQIYVLADTTYNSLSVDEVAAAHINAQCVVHYGRASLTKVSRLPAYFVFPRAELDISAATEVLAAAPIIQEAIEESPAIIFLDQPHLHVLHEFRTALESQLGSSAERLIFADVPARHLDPVGVSLSDPQTTTIDKPTTQKCCNTTSNEPSSTACCTGTTDNNSQCGIADSNTPVDVATLTITAAGYTWSLPSSTTNLSNCRFIWIGDPEAPALSHLQLTYNTSQWAVYNPDRPESGISLGLSPDISKVLKRRYFLVEKAKNAAIIGIVVGTLGAAGYRQVLDKLQAAARAAGKKTYTLLMGKPSPAKLANFPEIEVFVLVADPQGQILDSKEYLAPIITPHEAMLAFSGGEWDASQYSLDLDSDAFEHGAASGDEPRFSLYDGSYHEIRNHSKSSQQQQHEEEREEGILGDDPSTTALALHAQHALTVSRLPEDQALALQPRSAAEYFVNKRTWTGVEAPIVGADEKAVEKAVMGRSGRAAQYKDESQ